MVKSKAFPRIGQRFFAGLLAWFGIGMVAALLGAAGIGGPMPGMIPARVLVGTEGAILRIPAVNSFQHARDLRGT